MPQEGNGLKWYDNFRNRGKGYYGIDIIIKDDGQTAIEWPGPPYILGTNMIDIYINGVFQQKTAYKERTGNSIIYIAQIPLDKDDVVSIRYRPTSIGNIRVVLKYEELAKIKNPFIGEVCFVQEDKIFYIYNEHGEWIKLAQLVENVDEAEQKYLFETESIVDDDIVLTNIINWIGPEYIMNTCMLDVYLNGVLLSRFHDYDELDPTSIQYKGSVTLILNDVITIKYRYTKVNLGNIHIKETYNSLEEIYKPVIGSCALVKNKKKIFYWNGTIWTELFDLASGLVEIETRNTDTLTLKYDGGVISGEANISTEIGNVLENRKGLYVQRSSIRGFSSLIVEDVQQNDIVTIPKTEEEYGFDGIGILKVYELIQDLNVSEILNAYTQGNEQKFKYDPNFVHFTSEGAKLQTEETLDLEYIRDLEDGYKLYKIELDLKKYKKILI